MDVDACALSGADGSNGGGGGGSGLLSRHVRECVTLR